MMRASKVDIQGSSPSTSQSRRNWMVVFLCVALAVLVVGYWSVENRIRSTDSDLRNAMLEQVVFIAHTINPERVKPLTFTAADAHLPEFQILEQQMRGYQTVSGYRGIYSLAMRDGELRFGPESYTPDDPEASPVGTVYEDPVDKDFSIFETGKPIVEGPFSDEYGSFVSALAPVVDPRSGDVLMVVGIDLEANEWQARLNEVRVQTVLEVAVLTIILVAGVLMMVMREDMSAERRFRLRYLETIIIGVFGLALTLILAQEVSRGENRARSETFHQLAESRVQILQTAFTNLQDNRLGSLAHFFESSEFVSRQEFADFTSSMVKAAAIQGMGWIQPVPASDKAVWEARAQAEGVDGFFIWQLEDGQKVSASGRDPFYTVWYAEPADDNADAFGYDVGSEPNRRAAFEAAQASGLAVATDPITLVVDTGEPISVGIYMPVFSDESNRQSLMGFCLVVVRLDTFLQSVLSSGVSDDQSALVELFQLEDGQEPHFLASSSPEHTAYHLSQPGGTTGINLENASLNAIYPMFVFGKSYGLVVQADEAFVDSYPLRARWAALLMGILFTGLVMGFIFYVSGRRADLESQVRARTAELAASQTNLIMAYDATIEGWSHALELRDEETEGHTRRVTRLTERLARAMGINEEELEHIRRGALLHDIGKIGISDEILLKPGELTNEEWETVRQHPVFARDLLAPIDYLQPALTIPYAHHERWNGSGYPLGLEGERIPLEARIFAVADVYDALTSDRPYRKAWSRKKALDYIRRQAGEQFDPRVVKLFLREIQKRDMD